MVLDLHGLTHSLKIPHWPVATDLGCAGCFWCKWSTWQLHVLGSNFVLRDLEGKERMQQKSESKSVFHSG